MTPRPHSTSIRSPRQEGVHSRRCPLKKVSTQEGVHSRRCPLKKVSTQEGVHVKIAGALPPHPRKGARSLDPPLRLWRRYMRPRWGALR